MRLLIAGVDPGSTVGISILDLDGSLIKIMSFRNKGISEVIKRLMDFGKVVVVGTDVSPAPNLIEKIASSINCKLVVPGESLKLSQKHNIIGRFFEKKFKFKDKHERDSLVAAIVAFKFYNVLFSKIENKIKDKKKARKIKELVLIKNMNIQEALREI